MSASESTLRAQNSPSSNPSARLLRAPAMSFPSQTDSNSPIVWELVEGRPRMFALTSIDGFSMRHSGDTMARLASVGPVEFENHPGHGVWFESVIPDVDGTWYGFYHNEWPADRLCTGDPRAIPHIGAARSADFGATWQDLGVVLEAPPGSHDCGSTNEFFVGGVGDFSAVLDGEHRFVYFFFSQYANRQTAQGVSVARLPWADRGAPAGKAAVWLRNQTWLPSRTVRIMGGLRQVYPAGGPIHPVSDDWHNGSVDAFWGPSVHWNTYLGRYVMLLNRARDSSWRQEGVYLAYATKLNDPSTWSAPQRLVAGGRWYPQVVGLEAGVGSDSRAGEVARFFMEGRSEHFIQFGK
jgi:hypothetical protein